MIKYNIRSIQLIDIVGDVKRGKVVLSPYFQRNLVWRLIHQQDFIKTILLGYPFPQIFLAKGGIDAEELTSRSLIVDGQQRVNSIIEFIAGKFSVDSNFYSDLTNQQRDDFLKYEIAIIELQMERNNPEIKEIFQRLNRTFYSLTNIEKLSTEYAPSEFMLLAKLLSGEIDFKKDKGEYELDPNIPKSFVDWAVKKDVSKFNNLVINGNIFTSYEIKRQVPLMVTLNILGTIERGFFNRNLSTSILEEYSETFEDRDNLVTSLNAIADKLTALKLPDDSYWLNKANFFSLVIVFYNNYLELVDTKTPRAIVTALKKFEKDLPDEYSLAAKEAVNNKKERIIRNNFLSKILL